MQNVDNDNVDTSGKEKAPPKSLSPAAQRALREADERRQAEARTDIPTEYGGRGGADPARFGDWEINGRAIDF
jgi:hypothetical protein